MRKERGGGERDGGLQKRDTGFANRERYIYRRKKSMCTVAVALGAGSWRAFSRPLLNPSPAVPFASRLLLYCRRRRRRSRGTRKRKEGRKGLSNSSLPLPPSPLFVSPSDGRREREGDERERKRTGNNSDWRSVTAAEKRKEVTHCARVLFLKKGKVFETLWAHMTVGNFGEAMGEEEDGELEFRRVKVFVIDSIR